MNLTRLLLERALGSGFDDAGVCLSGTYPEMERLRQWIALGMHAGLGYMPRREAMRLDPGRVLPGARSVVMFVKSYLRKEMTGSELENPVPIARYAWGRDYHAVMRSRTDGLVRMLKEMGFSARAFTDTGPFMEKVLAVRCGLGVFGRNSLLIHPRLGSWTVLSGIVTDAVLEPTCVEPSSVSVCRECNACVQACPVGALDGSGLVDARKCLSYWNVEHKGSFPDGTGRSLDGRVFGCDVCQEVCPMNSDAEIGRPGDFEPLMCPPFPGLVDLAGLSAEVFDASLGATAMKRAGVLGIVRNAKAIIDAQAVYRFNRGGKGTRGEAG